MHAVETMFSGEGLVPWHGLGTVVEGLLTAEEALKAAGLDWTVERQPIYFGESKEIFPGRQAIVRMSDNKGLGIVGPIYQMFQNVESFEFFDNLVANNEAKYTAAGALHGGKKVWITAKVGGEILVGGEDAHQRYLLITNTHDGSGAFTAALVMIRAVCQNTVTMALNGASHKWTLRHQTSLSGKVQEAREALDMTFKYDEAFEAEVQKMMKIQVTKDKFEKLVNNLVPESKVQKKKTVSTLMDIFENEKTVNDAFGAGTAFGAYNTITFFTDHVKKYHTNNSRFNSLVDAGFADKLRNKAHKSLMAMK